MWCQLLCFGLLLTAFVIADKSRRSKHPIFVNSNSTKQLQFVQAVWRHGDRAPGSLPYPNDKYDEEYWPRGWNQLTNEGMRQLKDLGSFLRQRYANSFINHTYNMKEVFVHSSDKARAIVSAQSLLSGMFPPSKAERFEENLDWHPIPVHCSGTNDEDPALNMQFKGDFYDSAPMYPMYPILKSDEEEIGFTESAPTLAKSKKKAAPVKWQDKPKRKRRTSFTPDQLKVLLENFESESNSTSVKMASIASKLELEEGVIRNWFSNRRQKIRRELAGQKKPTPQRYILIEEFEAEDVYPISSPVSVTKKAIGVKKEVEPQQHPQIDSEVEKEEQFLLKPTKFVCPAYDEEVGIIQKEFAKNLFLQNVELFKFIRENSGFNNFGLEELKSLSEVTKEVDHEMKQPAWLTKKWADGKTTIDLIREHALAERVSRLSTEKLAQLRGGYLLGDWLDRILRVREGKQNKPSKMLLYSSHDGTLQSFLHVLGVADGLQVPYAACVIMEIYKDIQSGEYSVKLLFRHGKEISPLKVKGCGEECSVDKFSDLLEKRAFFSKKDLYEACGRKDYCEPTLQNEVNAEKKKAKKFRKRNFSL